MILVTWFAFAVCIVTGLNMPSFPGRSYTSNRTSNAEVMKNIIFVDKQVTAELLKGKSNKYYFLLSKESDNFLLIVTPCQSEIVWSVYLRRQNETGLLNQTTPNNLPPLFKYKGKEPQIFMKKNAKQGLYEILVTSTQRDTSINLYVSRQPKNSIIPRKPKLRFQKRQRKRKLTIRWEPSELDPFNMHYCITVSSTTEYKSICEANNSILSSSTESILDKWEKIYNQSPKSQLFMACVKKKTSYTVDNLEPGMKYYFSIFLVNKESKFTFLYGNTSMLFENRSQAVRLKDNKPTSISLRKFDGKAVFRYKVPVETKQGAPLEWQVQPCGGTIAVEIRLKKKTIISRQTISSYTKLTVPVPDRGKRYSLHMFSADPEVHVESEVEVVATTQDIMTPIGIPPEEAKVITYGGLSQCNSVTIGWYSIAHKEMAHYCIRVSEIDEKSSISTKIRLKQCGLDSKLKSFSNYYLTKCIDRSPNEFSQLIIEKVRNLKPGKKYTIQVTVKRTKGKTLSYNLVRAETKKC